MQINGQYVGIGEGDESDEVAKIIVYMRKMYTPARTTIAEGTRKVTAAVTVEIKREQGVFVTQGKLALGSFIYGVINLATKYASGYLKAPAKTLPIFFTFEGHMSNMFFGPTASCASLLEAEGLCHWKPASYNSNKLPFDNPSGVKVLFDFLASNQIEGPPVDPNNPDGPKIMWDFGPDVPWELEGFSQGSMVVSEGLQQLPNHANPVVRARAKTLRRSLCLGNPKRAKDSIAPWADNPPNAGTSGIFVHSQFVTKGTWLDGIHEENANDNDMFSENTDDKTGWDKEAIAKIICENSWSGGPVSILARVMALFGNPTGEAFSAIKAAFDAIMFLASNPNPHYSTIAEPGDIIWMREGLTG